MLPRRMITPKLRLRSSHQKRNACIHANVSRRRSFDPEQNVAVESTLDPCPPCKREGSPGCTLEGLKAPTISGTHSAEPSSQPLLWCCAGVCPWVALGKLLDRRFGEADNPVPGNALADNLDLIGQLGAGVWHVLRLRLRRKFSVFLFQEGWQAHSVFMACSVLRRYFNLRSGECKFGGARYFALMALRVMLSFPDSLLCFALEAACAFRGLSFILGDLSCALSGLGA